MEGKVMILVDKVPQACEPQWPRGAKQRCKTLHACKTLVASLTSSNSGECFDCEFLEFSHTVCVIHDLAVEVLNQQLKSIWRLGKQAACRTSRSLKRHATRTGRSAETRFDIKQPAPHKLQRLEWVKFTTLLPRSIFKPQTETHIHWSSRNFTKSAFWHTPLPLAFSWCRGIGEVVFFASSWGKCKGVNGWWHCIALTSLLKVPRPGALALSMASCMPVC